MRRSIWWIRRDVRLSDNPALFEAASQSEQVLPVFILDPTLWSKERAGAKRLKFLAQGLKELDASIRIRGGQLLVREGDPLAELQRLKQETGAEAVFAQQDVSPYGKKRDLRVSEQLSLQLTGGLSIHPPAAVRKQDGQAYTVFTPYSRVWKSLPPPQASHRLSPPERFLPLKGVQSLPLPDPNSYPTDLPLQAGEAAAQKVLHDFTGGDAPPIGKYASRRDRLDLPGTSFLSAYLRFGMLSPRQAAVAAHAIQADPSLKPHHAGAESWLRQLIWREFFIGILDAFPEVLAVSFRSNLRNIPWRNRTEEFDAWREGRTGYPVVDAAMRQLRHTGWMHNRARLIAASFLVKHLLVDWRWGERWFMQNLIDGDPASNNGGWQWTAGTGTDAAPFFRIFNPILQGKKFDPDGEFVRRWVPELMQVPASHIHVPWELSANEQDEFGVRMGSQYPMPIVEHSLARERALAAFAAAKEA